MRMTCADLLEEAKSDRAAKRTKARVKMKKYRFLRYAQKRQDTKTQIIEKNSIFNYLLTD